MDNSGHGEKKRAITGIFLGAILGFIAWALMYNCFMLGRCTRRSGHAARDLEQNSAVVSEEGQEEVWTGVIRREGHPGQS